MAYMQAQAQRSQLEQKISAQDLTQGVNYTDQATGLCPACHQDSGGGKFCQHCGAALSAAPAATKRFCSNCGTELTGGIKFCGECGTAAP
jgi:DNA-directed RNA polymerase subunit M/transcription elongation factor TFIIS